MKYKRKSIYIGILFLALLAACGPATGTPTPEKPFNNQPPQVPNHPLTVVPPAPSCVPPVPYIDQVTSFCANKGAGLGGASYDYHPNEYEPSFVFASGPMRGNIKCYEAPNGRWNCSGPQGAKFNNLLCTYCSLSNTNASSICVSDTAPNQNGDCQPPANDADRIEDMSPCLPGTHYDNDKQDCVDDVSGTVVPKCPAAYPYFDLDKLRCYSKPVVVYNCQYFTVQLGQCLKKANPSQGCQPPPGGCGTNPLTRMPKNWDPASCSCK
jgi:hypothetical protein